MKWSWLIALRKVFFAALGSVLTLLIYSGGLDTFFTMLQEGVGTLGLPVWAIPLVLAGIKFVHNLAKQYLTRKVPPPVQ